MDYIYETYVRLRDERGMSDYAVAKDAGISSSKLYDWKSGKSAPKVDNLRKIANALGVQLMDLIDPVPRL